ncbi:hypothetical protein [Pediococcus ethanolidurans]|nr:hypothetical protein [Pediococcus ethanolidurans]MCV3314621.1 hypothetical protein [Pediococcus ethanolidurans]MCV3321214.1 hypothetical protein [Pediococcus ethanolidurans]MCV3323671.1 hypothetical protein [Pediococcus ethanolidurans]MCV3555557.1 hypothetical protein [Pediococcus ethanolidurans]
MKYSRLMVGLSTIFMALILTACQTQKVKPIIPRKLSQNFIIYSQFNRNS